ncbi:MAG: type II 3-dehydroquinate dehydratase [Candidatus Marinimicrobia bacterium]|nr:type II 3-dehydroquinate dehydratase [Candidatus Neomarinimicrobiota bacterium]|tara:strand:+ start:7928 stop:8365 length:438 start_codon:yes stop_codon:yes gene_type:complete
MNILVINGPNLNLLGERQTDIYGENTLEELMMWLETSADGQNHNFKFYQSNHEGTIIDSIHDEREWADGMIINAGAFSHYSYAIRDAISSVDINTVEVHLSNIMEREDFRKISVLKDVCIEQIYGLGRNSYIEALKFLQDNSKGD